MFSLAPITLLQRIAEPTPFFPPPFPPPEISSFGGTSIAITPSGTQKLLPTPIGEEVFYWVISSDLLSLNDPGIFTLFHRYSPDIFFAPSSLALSCSWEVLQDLGSDYLPILLSVPLSPIFCSNERPPSFNFQKARWNDFASYFNSHWPSAEEYSYFSSASTLFTSTALNAGKSSIPFGRI